MKHRKGKIFLAGVMSLTIIFSTGCGLLPMKQENRVAPIAQTVEQQQYVYVSVEQGDVVDTETVILSANFGESNYLRFDRSSSMVAKTYFEVGDTVKEGDLLIEAESSGVLSQITQLENNINEYNVNIDYYTGLLEIENERQRIYIANGMSYDDSMLSQYQKSLDYYNDAIDVAYRQLAEAEQDYNNTHIYAPFDGTIVYIAEVGEELLGKQSAVNLVREDIYYYATTDKEEYFEVGETYRAEYRYRQAALVDSYDLDELENLLGEVDESIFNVEVVSDFVDLECKEINLLNEDTGVYEIMFGYNSILTERDVMSTHITFTIDIAKSVLYVPRASVITTSNGYAVYMLSEDGSRTIQDVEVGLNGDDFYEIKSGLSLGDQVILDNARVDEELIYDLYKK